MNAFSMSKDSNGRLSKMYERPGFLLRRAHQISAGIFETECGEAGLTPAQFAVISVLAATPMIDQSSLARSVGYDKVTVMYVLRGLIERGIVLREESQTKRRVMALSLSKEGVKYLEKVQKPTEAAYSRLMEPFTEPQRKQFIKLLQILTTSLDAEARAPLVIPSEGQG
ncbi:MarR family winged helix-turn-helix transcriptional regulator [Xylophilus sp. GOD-11R]|uniref:MarR family winged helix-turn-helix transcriptional regulator n=1 Tax=Xylophilus sp. GOD-11R TaxID=3089814 RepID=UPI00298CAC3C|nr:MarR family transcriptional regulator [Xylophilus sp. GOD-11R]WPB57168.1 MarR family transcriptional regulator [Xylophilus sp. GOD-11R]